MNPVTWQPFDPEEGMVLRDPPGEGPGYWAGAPGACYEPASDRFYLCYRYRRPRGVHSDRGAEFIVAESRNGVEFEDRWRLTKDQLGSLSIERGCLRRLPDGRFGLYISYVDPADQRWRIDMLEADAPDEFEAADRRPVFTAGQLGIEGIKDPWIMSAGPALWMVVSFAAAAEGVDPGRVTDLHGTADCYDTGLVLSHSGLGVSGDGRHWQWLGSILTAEAPERAWDGYSARIAAICRTGDCYTAFYDGAIGVRDHYDERTGLALSFDLHHWTRLTPEGPCLRSPHASGCLRYLDVVEARGRSYYYYEYARPDGAHELRVNVTR